MSPPDRTDILFRALGHVNHGSISRLSEISFPEDEIFAQVAPSDSDLKLLGSLHSESRLVASPAAGCGIQVY